MRSILISLLMLVVFIVIYEAVAGEEPGAHQLIRQSGSGFSSTIREIDP